MTGGTGYVAGWCIRRLLDEGHRVRTTVRDLDRADDLRSRLPSDAQSTERLEFVAADLHLLALTSDAAAGERFLGTGEFVWMSEIADALRSGLGDDAAKVPTRRLPDLLVKAAALVSPDLREITVSLGRKNRHTTAKAERLLGWTPDRQPKRSWTARTAFWSGARPRSGAGSRIDTHLGPLIDGLSRYGVDDTEVPVDELTT